MERRNVFGPPASPDPDPLSSTVTTTIAPNNRAIFPAYSTSRNNSQPQQPSVIRIIMPPTQAATNLPECSTGNGQYINCNCRNCVRENEENFKKLLMTVGRLELDKARIRERCNKLGENLTESKRKNKGYEMYLRQLRRQNSELRTQRYNSGIEFEKIHQNNDQLRCQLDAARALILAVQESTEIFNATNEKCQIEYCDHMVEVKLNCDNGFCFNCICSLLIKGTPTIFEKNENGIKQKILICAAPRAGQS